MGAYIIPDFRNWATVFLGLAMVVAGFVVSAIAGWTFSIAKDAAIEADRMRGP
jgi:hypothetical protein